MDTQVGSRGAQRETVLKSLVRIAFLGAVGGLLMIILEIPLLPSAPYLKWDAGDVPALLGAFSMGPLAGLLIEFVKIGVWQATGKNATGVVGASANLVAGLAFVVTAGAVYRGWRSRAGAVLGMAVGTIAMTGAMCVANALVFFPLWGIKGDAVGKALVSAAIPFNLMKGVVSSAIGFVLYKRVRRYLGGTMS